jgi:hypothetical protein
VSGGSGGDGGDVIADKGGDTDDYGWYRYYRILKNYY